MRDSSSGAPTAVSVVITSFNDGPILAEALASVAGQSIRPLEILVIDDGSAPATAPAVIDSIRATHDLDVAYTWQENQGPSAARNVGIANARGEFIAFLDADDRWLPDHLELKLARMTGLDSRYSSVFDAFVEFDGESGGRLSTIPCGDFDGPISEASLGLPHGVPAGLQFQLHRTEALHAVGGLDPELRVNEDFDLLLRLGKAGYRMAGSGRVTVERRVHRDSLTRKDPERTFLEVTRFLDKAEREGLMPPERIASRRKWERMNLARAMMARSEYPSRAVIHQLRDAFRHAGPTGARQWAAYLLGHSGLLGIAMLNGYRMVTRDSSAPRRTNA